MWSFECELWSIKCEVLSVKCKVLRVFLVSSEFIAWIPQWKQKQGTVQKTTREESETEEEDLNNRTPKSVDK